MSGPRHKHHLLLPEIGGQGQKKLARSSVLVVGAGGLGCPILAYLGAAGVGRIIVCDPDHVELSNLQRQILYRQSDIGQPKAEAAKSALLAIDPALSVQAIAARFPSADAPALLAGVDLVIEGTDRIEARHAINRACLAAGRPLLSSAASRFEGQVGLFGMPRGEGPCYACLVPEGAGEDGLCDRDGVLGPVVGLVGSLAATEAIKFLLGMTPSLAGHLLVADAREGSVRRVALPRDPACPVCG